MMVLPVRPETFRRSEVVPRQTSRLLKRIERAAFDFPKRAQEKGSVNEMGLRYASRFDGVTGSAIRDIFKLLTNPEIISFAGGNPANSALQSDVVSRLAQKVLAENGVGLLQYGQTEGYAPLRESAAEFFRHNGVDVKPEELLPVTGSQQALDLICKAMLDPGDAMLVESPTFLGALQTFKLYQAKLVPVDAGPRQKEKLRAAIDDNVCAIFYAVVRSEETLTFEETLEVAKQARVPLVVNAMSQIPPKESLWRFTKAGAEAAVFAGGRALCGPASSGFIVGKKWLTDAILSIAPPKHSIASIANIGREEVVGLYTALEEYLAGDDFAAHIQRTEELLRDLRHRMEKEGYFLCRRAYPGPVGQNYPCMVLEILGAYSAEALVEMLAQGDPAILVRRTFNEDCENGIYINLFLLNDEQVEIVLRRVVECAEKLTLMN